MALRVWNDYGHLKEVAVGTTDGTVVSGYSDAYPKFARELTRQYAGHAASAVPGLRELMQAAQAQLDNLAQIYRDHGVVVHRPRHFTKEETAYQSELQIGDVQLFPADPIWIIGRNVIECQFRQPFRNKERFTLRELIASEIDVDPEVRIQSCPVTMPVDINSTSHESSGKRDYILEGGDIQICGNEGKDVLVGVDELRSTSARGAEWLRRQIADDGFRVTPVPIRPGAPIHLLGAMGVFGPEGAMIYRPAFANGIPEPMRRWDLIDITVEEAQAGGPCAVMLDPKTILIVAEAPRLIDILGRRGLNVIAVPFDAVIKFDGAIRCSTFVIHRTKD